MKRFKSLSVKNKRVLAIAGVSVVALGVVGTIAYNQDWMNFANIFRPASDVVEFSETFDSPDDWQPCQEIPKTAIATNKNASPRYVRMKINEYWRTKNSQTPTTDHETTDLALTWTDNGVEKHYAVINTQNDDKWELGSDGWYYYKTTLAQDESTDSLLKSVTFNCEVNTVGEIRYALDGSTFEGVSSDYADANYHLYITFQMSDEDMKPKKHEADCDNATELYDLIACRTNGPDTGVDFVAASTEEGVNGWGINTLNAHKDDYYPVYYFRGVGALKNNVIWDNKCWKIIRTTSTGGVKMSLAGNPVNGTCDDNPSASSYVNSSIVYPNGVSWFSSPGTVPTIGAVTYTFTNPHQIQNSINESGFSIYDELYFGNDIEWVNGEYHLIDTIHGAWRDIRDTAGTRYHYFCFGGSDTCPSYRAGYAVIYGNSSDIFFYRLYDGRKIEDIKNEMFNGTYTNSPKQALEGWFGSLGRPSDLEDTVFCNDKKIISGPLKDKDSPWDGFIAKFAAYGRLFEKGADGNYHPSVDCGQKEDSYTVEESDYGNGILNKPVGLITGDELMLVGYSKDHSQIDQWYAGLTDWTMTPGWYNERYDGPMMVAWSIQMVLRGLTNSQYRFQLRPVVSLKAGMSITSGDGSGATPYVISTQ